MKRLTLIILFALASLAQAQTTVYVDGTLGANITDGTYDIAGRTTGGSDGDCYTTIQEGANQLTAGDTLYVRAGIYYEMVTINSLNGTSGSPITISTYNSETVEVSGTDAITGWTQSVSDEAYLTTGGTTNPNYASIYWTRVLATEFPADLRNTYLFEDGSRSFICSYPDQSESYGESVYEFKTLDAGSDGQAAFLIDSDLTQADDYWNGAYLRVLLYLYNNNVVTLQVSDFDAATDTLTFASPSPADLNHDANRQDTYRIFNHPQLIDEAGEFFVSEEEVFEGQTWRRIYAWPSNTGNLTALMRLPVRYNAFASYASGARYVVVDGFTVWGTSSYGIKFDASSASHGSEVTVKNCIANDTIGTGIYFYGQDQVLIEDCQAYRSGNRGIMTIDGIENVITGCIAGGTNSTNISFYNAQNSSIIYNECFGARGGHGNGISTYGNIGGPWITNVLVAGNMMHNCNISQNYASNYACFGNVFDMIDDADLEQQAITPFASSYSGYFLVMHNTAPRTLRTAYSMMGEGTYGTDPQHYIANNVFDGMSWNWQLAGEVDWMNPVSGETTVVQCEYNAFTRYEFTQASSRGYYAATGDVDLTSETLDAVFANPTYLTGDWAPETDGSIDSVGTDVQTVLSTLGIIAMHPDYDFTRDLDGDLWGAQPSLGAYAGSASGTGTAPTITSNGGGATAAITVDENQTAVTTVTATGTATITYTISAGADAALFGISSGVVTFNSAPDYETPGDANTDNDYEITVTATNSYGSDAQDITITVDDVSEGGSTYLIAYDWR